ncbi:MAG TPA: hypothetical protein VFB63_06815 [Bryobacteraceae bacterium]|nr:hypothetical protein [Bryobacteraceae bacterium]
MALLQGALDVLILRTLVFGRQHANNLSQKRNKGGRLAAAMGRVLGLEPTEG